MKKFAIFLGLLLVSSQVFAFNSKKTDVEYMYKDVKKEIGHELAAYEKVIVDTTYLYYQGKCSGKWDKTTWKLAVSKSAEFCQSNAAVNAAKAGKFSQNFLKSLLAGSANALSSFSSWLSDKSEELQEKLND